ncbi:MAG: hypothetical protein RR332_06645, partial [Clostridiales bacterium]
MKINKDELRRQVFAVIERETDNAVDFLTHLVALPSELFKSTAAQALVQQKLAQMDFEIDIFPCDVDSIKNEDDFYTYPQNLKVSKQIENVVGLRRSIHQQPGKSLLLFAHIDTAAMDEVMPDTQVTVDGDRIYGLGVADDKSGVAMMLLGAEAVLRLEPQLLGDLTLMSTIGKRGSVGTFTAFKRGYKADIGVYLHPAETGYGFREIKNYSLGWLDFKLKITGRPGPIRDDVDDSEINAIVKGCQVVQAVMDWDKQRRNRLLFAEGSFVGKPNTKVNVVDVHSGELVGSDALLFEANFNICFGLGESIHTVSLQLQEWLADYFVDDPWLHEHPPELIWGDCKATPVYVSEDSPVMHLVKNNIKMVKGLVQFNEKIQG